MSYQPKVALVHDDWVQYGGAERLFEAIASEFPKAPIYTSLVDWDKLPTTISRNRVRPSFIQKIPLAKALYKLFLTLYPLAFESFNFDKYDIVVSSTTRFAKSIITKPQTTHICYINSIPRFLYKEELKKDYLHPIFFFVLSPVFTWLRRWDFVSAHRPDVYIANSQNVQKQLKEIYHVDSQIIHPFADTEFFKMGQKGQKVQKGQEYFLIVSRLVPWKRIDLVLKAASELKLNLKIVGEGPDFARLRSLAKYQIQFLGNVSKEKLRELYQNCKVLIIPQEEDFGIATVEAQACGKPVIAYEKGGQKEIVIDGKTGVFFQKQTPQSLQDAIDRFSRLKWDAGECRKNSLRFSKERFTRDLKEIVSKYAPTS